MYTQRNTKKKRTGKLALMLLIVLNIITSTLIVYAETDTSPYGGLEITGANVDESKVSVIYYVDGSNENASDQNPGTEEEPFKTIGKAVTTAMEDYKKGQGVKIIVYPGVYREGITMIGSGNDSSVPFILEGLKKGEVILKGSTVFKDPWQPDGEYFTHSWLMGWKARDDIYTDYDIYLDEIVRRKEMIFVDGHRLEQVLSKEELTEGSFFIDEKGKMAYLIPPAGVNMDENSLVEIPLYDTILRVRNMKNVVIRNLMIQQGNSYQPFDVFDISHSSNVLVEDCDVSWNNWFGLGLFNVRDITVNRVTSTNNGGGGFQGAGMDNVVIKDSETSGNNWRGMKGKYYAWDTGGIKFLFAYKVKISGHKSIGNYAPGIWFDSECRDIILEDCYVKGNNSPSDSIVGGFYLEGSIGPFYVNRCTVIENRRGIIIASSNDVKIKDTVIANNEYHQIVLFNNWGHGRTFESRETGEDVTSYARDTVIEDTIISAPVDSRYPFVGYDHEDPGSYNTWRRTLKTKNVHYYHPRPDQAFLMGDIRTLGDLAGWQELTGLDSDAVWIPGPPSELKLNEDDQGNCVLSWNPSPTNVQGYAIFCNNEKIGETTGTDYRFGKPEDAGEYYYAVKAYDSEGNFSAGSNVVTIVVEGQLEEHVEEQTEEPSDDRPDEQVKDQPVQQPKGRTGVNPILIAILVFSLILLVLTIMYFINITGKAAPVDGNANE